MTEQLAAGNRVPFTVISGSMAPFLLLGDRVVVSRPAGRQLAVGDIVLVRTLPQPLVHRVIELTTDGAAGLVHTKGDASARRDPPVNSATVLGVVTEIERGARHLHLTTGRARQLGALMATLSVWHERAVIARSVPLGWLVARGLRGGIKLLAWWAWRWGW